ncbi:MAG: zinc ribbon domain-containing protein [Desulfobacteraceae bacterium]|nr:zinc ribbon domain-containing protein [Desulfobacteraceae bacterium]
MPIYEYKCNDCNCQFEQLTLSADDPSPHCPTCCKPNVTKLMSAGSIRPQGVPTGSGGFSAPTSCKPSG